MPLVREAVIQTARANILPFSFIPQLHRLPIAYCLCAHYYSLPRLIASAYIVQTIQRNIRPPPPFLLLPQHSFHSLVSCQYPLSLLVNLQLQR